MRTLISRARGWAVLIGTILLPVPVFAQGSSCTCDEQETYATCYNSHAEQAVRENLNQGAAAEVANKPASDASPGAASSLRDTLAGFLSDLGLGTINTEDDTLTFNVNLDKLKLGESHKLSLAAVLRDPVPYAPLIQEFAEEMREESQTSLDEDLDDFDDTEIQASWSLENAYFGRAYRPHRAAISPIFEELIDQTRAATAAEDTKDLALLDTLRRIRAITVQTESPADVKSRIEELRNQGDRQQADDLEVQQAELQEAICEAGDAWAQAQAERIAAIKASEFVRVADLINNQPQLRIQGFYRNRDQIAGPDSYGAELNLEWGPANFNGFRDFCGKGRANLQCFSDFLTERRAFLLERAPRGSVEIKWARTDPHHISLVEDAIEFDREENEETVASAVIGLYVRSNDAGQQVARLDLEASHCDVDDDPDRQDRTVATLTYLQRVSEHSDASVSLVWANKPEFRGEVDEELSALAGLKLSFDRKQDDG